VNFSHELDWLRSIGHRVVVNQLDLIAYHNGSYFSSAQSWTDYRELARLTCESVDAVAFISEHAASEAAAEGLTVQAKATRVIYCGTEHVGTAMDPDPLVPPAAAQVKPGFVLFLGAAFEHKNRAFALNVYRRLVASGWSGSLVLAGPVPPSGSSLANEAEILLRFPEVADGVVHLGSVSEAEKVWLYRNAGLVLYPTVAEGFGLVPFEAAAHDVPCLSTRQGSLDEILPADIVTLVDWSPEHAAAQALALLNDAGAAAAVVKGLKRRAGDFSWALVAERLDELFLDVLSAPAVHQRTLGQLDDRRRTFPRANQLLVKVVTTVTARPELKDRLTPEGSRRQTYARALIRRVGSHL
jgi:glycosyltransferase involved in cell wall biosynthesis